MDEQTAKKGILERIRNGKPESLPLPKPVSFPYTGKPVEDFISHLLGFDGRAIEFRTRDDALAWLEKQPELDVSRNRIYSSAKGVAGNVAEADLSDLRSAARINTCVTEAELGVGEMGALWVTDRSLVHAVTALLCRHLFILLDARCMTGGLHEAYAAINLAEHQYGSFYTGPSATADIEAVHITGAQGPLALTALLYNLDSAPDTPVLMVNPNADTSRWQKEMERDE